MGCFFVRAIRRPLRHKLIIHFRIQKFSDLNEFMVNNSALISMRKIHFLILALTLVFIIY